MIKYDIATTTSTFKENGFINENEQDINVLECIDEARKIRLRPVSMENIISNIQSVPVYNEKIVNEVEPNNSWKLTEFDNNIVNEISSSRPIRLSGEKVERLVDSIKEQENNNNIQIIKAFDDEPEISQESIVEEQVIEEAVEESVQKINDLNVEDSIKNNKLSEEAINNINSKEKLVNTLNELNEIEQNSIKTIDEHKEKLYETSEEYEKSEELLIAKENELNDIINKSLQAATKENEKLIEEANEKKESINNRTEKIINEIIENTNVLQSGIDDNNNRYSEIQAQIDSYMNVNEEEQENYKKIA